MQLKKKHEIELSEQKEEYGNLLREENSKWKLQKEELESEISKLKKVPSKTSASTIQKSQDADLTAFIRDLKESAHNLSSTEKSQGKRSASMAATNNMSNTSTSSNSRLTSNVKYNNKTFPFLISIFRNDAQQLPIQGYNPKIVKR